MQADSKMKIKPPPSTSSDKGAAALKAQLELELRNKKQCSFQPYECTQLTLDGYKYCLKHILQDKNAPYKQCSFVFTNSGKRCQLAAPRIEKKDFGYCKEHAVKTALIKTRQNARCPAPQSAEVLLYSLAHHVKKPRNRTVSGQSDDVDKNVSDDLSELKVTKSLDPFKEIDATALNNSACNNILDLCSESDSDVEASTFSTVWHDPQLDSSDNESIDSDHEDPLKHANVYTAEEISSIARDKLIKLQSLYIEQYRHLQHVFKEKKRKYYHSLKREKETCCNIYNQIRDNPKEQRMYRKLKALGKYHKTHGDEAILNKRLHDQRAKITDGLGGQKSGTYTKCSFTEGGVKCGERTLPLARHCRKHILEDPGQVLFDKCGKFQGEVECTTPMEVIFEDSSCSLHKEMPPVKSYTQLRKNSESDFEDSLENVENILMDQSDLSTSVNVKTELIDYKPELPQKTLPSMLFEEDVVKTEPEIEDDSNNPQSSTFGTNVEGAVDDIKVEDDDDSRSVDVELKIDEDVENMSTDEVVEPEKST